MGARATTGGWRNESVLKASQLVGDVGSSHVDFQCRIDHGWVGVVEELEKDIKDRCLRSD